MASFGGAVAILTVAGRVATARSGRLPHRTAADRGSRGSHRSCERQAVKTAGLLTRFGFKLHAASVWSGFARILLGEQMMFAPSVAAAAAMKTHVRSAGNAQMRGGGMALSAAVASDELYTHPTAPTVCEASPRLCHRIGRPFSRQSWLKWYGIVPQSARLSPVFSSENRELTNCTIHAGGSAARRSTGRAVCTTRRRASATDTCCPILWACASSLRSTRSAPTRRRRTSRAARPGATTLRRRRGRCTSPVPTARAGRGGCRSTGRSCATPTPTRARWSGESGT